MSVLALSLQTFQKTSSCCVTKTSTFHNTRLAYTVRDHSVRKLNLEPNNTQHKLTSGHISRNKPYLALLFQNLTLNSSNKYSPSAIKLSPRYSHLPIADSKFLSKLFMRKEGTTNTGAAQSDYPKMD